MNNSWVKVFTSSLVFIVLVLTAGCQVHTRIQDCEQMLLTNDKTMAQFHPIAAHQGGISLNFDGYILGLEKSPRYRIGIDAGVNEPLVQLQRDWFQRGRDKPSANRYYNNVKGILNDGKSMFVSHIYQYKNTLRQGVPFIDFNSLHNDYFAQGCRDHANADDHLDVLGQALANDIKQAKLNNETQYTHIIVIAMGWNTPQQESVRNFNSLMGHLFRQAPPDQKFRPLFVGITWPSEWAAGQTGFLAALKHGASYFNKAPDADEVGLLIVNQLLNQHLKPLKQKNELKMVLIGHSFGARLITRSVFGIPNGEPPVLAPSAPDLVVSLQGAYSVRRYMRNAGREGSPYADFAFYARKFVATWSEHDTANPIANWVTGAHHIGGDKGFETTQNSSAFNHLTVMPMNPSAQNRVFNNEKFFQQQDWQEKVRDPETVTMIDASNIIKAEQWGKGGKAHSDIYTPVIGQLLWNIMGALN